MTDKQLIIDGVDVSECNFCEWKSSDIPQCRIRLASFESTCKGYNCHYKQLKVENEKLIRRITKIFACLIKANRTNKIVDTLWVDNITTLWDYVAQTLGIEGDQVHIEEQILQKSANVR